MSKKRVWIVTCAVVGGALGGTGVLAAAADSGSPLAEVGPGILQETVVAQGSVTAIAGVADVRARIDGRVTRVLVREGDRVEAGQLLAEIDPAEVQAQLAQAQAEKRALDQSARSVAEGARTEERAAADAELKAAEAELRLAEDRAKRTSQLRATEAISEQAEVEARQQVDAARARVGYAKARRDLALAGGRHADVAAARDRVAAAGAAVDEADRRLQRTRVTAPVGGVVLARHVDEGDNVSPEGSSLFEIADPAKTEVLIEVEEPDSLRIAVGQKVTLTLPGGRVHVAEGKLVRLSAQLGKRTIGADDARLRAEHLIRAGWVAWEGAAGQALPIGKRLEAVVHLPARPVEARVPRNAVFIKDGHAQVDTGGLLGGSRIVTLGAADDKYVEVHGLPNGTPVRLRHD